MRIEHEVAWRAALSSGVLRPLAMLYAFAGATCLLGAVAPVAPEARVEVLAAVGCICIGVGVLLFVWSAPVPRWLLQTVISSAVVIAGVLINIANSLEGALVFAFQLPFVGLYVAYYLTRRAARLHIAFTVFVFTVAYFTRVGPAPAVAWAVVVTAIVATAEVTGKLVTELQRSAVTDSLTGLVNRNGLMPALEREIARAARTGRHLAVAVIDLDGLKQVNDVLGHASGDRLLCDLTYAWTECLRTHDILARLGGDEFVLVLPETTATEAREVVGRLRDIDGPARDTRWSAGIASLRAGEDAEHILERADRRMYAAKRAGREVEVGT